jgi:hypothetical protein
LIQHEIYKEVPEKKGEASDVEKEWQTSKERQGRFVQKDLKRVKRGIGSYVPLFLSVILLISSLWIKLFQNPRFFIPVLPMDQFTVHQVACNTP